MTFQINTNLSALSASYYADKSVENASLALEKLGTGKVINSSKDDAAGIAISSRMGSEISQKQKIAQNLQNSFSFLQVQQSFISESSKLLNRANILKHRFHSVETNQSDKINFDHEFREIQLQLREMQSQKFNGISLFASGNIGSLASASNHEKTLSVESYKDEQSINLHRTGIFDSLFMERSPSKEAEDNPLVMGDGSESLTTIETASNSGKISWSIDSFGQPDRFTIMLGSEVLFDEIYGNAGEQRSFGDGSVLTPTGGINRFNPVELEFSAASNNKSNQLKFIINKGNQLDPTDPSMINGNTIYGSSFNVEYYSFEESLTDGVIYSLNDFSFSEFSGFNDVMSNALAQNGASQQRIQFEIQDLYTNNEKLEIAGSRITDTDYALESTKLARHNLLAQNSAKMIGEANNLTKLALKIMGQQAF